MAELPKFDELISEARIQKRIVELASQIDRDYAGRELVAIGILQGSFLFFSDLVRRLKTPVRCEFLGLSSYGNPGSRSGEIRILLDIEESLEGKDLLVVEDLVDSGLTFRFLQRTLNARKPASLKTCVFLVRRHDKPREEAIDYVGFEIGNEFVVGYGVDYQGQYRGLPYVGLKERAS